MKTLVKVTRITWEENNHYNLVKTYSCIIAKAIINELIKQEISFSLEYEQEQIDVPFDED